MPKFGPLKRPTSKVRARPMQLVFTPDERFPFCLCCALGRSEVPRVGYADLPAVRCGRTIPAAPARAAERKGGLLTVVKRRCIRSIWPKLPVAMPLSQAVARSFWVLNRCTHFARQIDRCYWARLTARTVIKKIPTPHKFGGAGIFCVSVVRSSIHARRRSRLPAGRT